MSFFVMLVVKMWLVSLLVIGASCSLHETKTVTFSHCANAVGTTSINSKTFVIAFNVRHEVCVENCVVRPWCAAVMYDIKRWMCYILFEEDISLLEQAGANDNRGLTCAVVKKRDFPKDHIEVWNVLLLNNTLKIIILFQFVPISLIMCTLYTHGKLSLWFEHKIPAKTILKIYLYRCW